MKSTLLLFAPLLCAPCVSLAADPVYSDADRARISAFWCAPGRYTVGLPLDAAKNGPWQVRLTTQASTWLLAYLRAAGAAKAPPTTDASPNPASPDPAAEWEKWVSAKVAYDRALAQDAADRLNAVIVPSSVVHQPPSPIDPPPGLIPPALLAAAGNPPTFANVITPLKYWVKFDDGEILAFQDNVVTRPRFAYYRFANGTVAYGQPLKSMPDSELDALFEAAGFSPSEQRVAKAVSRLEGGFDAVNTYDTGFVSVGFIQFITGEEGSRSLIEVLEREKADKADVFQQDFHRFGLDVNADHVIVAVDPTTGAELAGRDAVQKIIDDKRFAAVFQRAGKHSVPFRVAQIEIAKSHYWPADDPVTVMIGGQTLTGKVSDVIKSEAGMATLFDRKVNRGNISPFADVLAKVIADHNLTSIADASAYEREIVQGIKYRTDFLQDPTLSQPK